MCKSNSQWQGQSRDLDSVHMHGKSMSKDALNKIRYVCLSNCLNDEMLGKPCTGAVLQIVFQSLTIRL